MRKLIFIAALCLALAGCSQNAPDNTPAVPQDPPPSGDSSCQAEAPDTSDSSQEDLPRMVMVDGILYYEKGPCEDIGRCGMMDGRIDSTVSGTPTQNNQSNFGTGYQYQGLGDGIDLYFPENDQWIRFAPRGVLFCAVVEEVRDSAAVVRSEEGQWNEGKRFLIPLDKIDRDEVPVESVLTVNCGDMVLETDPAQLEVYAAHFLYVIEE